MGAIYSDSDRKKWEKEETRDSVTFSLARRFEFVLERGSGLLQGSPSVITLKEHAINIRTSPDQFPVFWTNYPFPGFFIHSPTHRFALYFTEDSGSDTSDLLMFLFLRSVIHPIMIGIFQLAPFYL